ncbi:hypothetical protein KCU95_g888, partial [Aureobasidium melanogenum]
MEAYSNPQVEDNRRFAHQLLAAAHQTQLAGPPRPRQTTMADPRISSREMHTGAELNSETRPQVPTWSVANAKEAKPLPEPENQTIGTKVDTELSNGSHPASADADAQSDIDELLVGGDAEPEPPRYDGDFDIERHDYWWNLLDQDNPRHARASKGMRYGTERNPRCDTEARESHQQRTGFPLLKIGSARKRDDMEDDGSRSPPVEIAAKRPRLSSYSGGYPEGSRGLNATPSRPAFDAPASVNGRHYSPIHIPGSVTERERSGANGDSARSTRHDADARQYYDSHNDISRTEDKYQDRYQNPERYEVSAREMNNLLNLVEKLQREVRILRSKLDGMEARVDHLSGAVDTYRP